MSGIEFEYAGEGLSPREISGYFQPEEPLPVFRQSYHGQFLTEYRASGYLPLEGLPHSLDIGILLEIRKAMEAEGRRAVVGPSLSEGSLMLSGAQIYYQPVPEARRLSTAA